LNFLFWIKYSF